VLTKDQQFLTDVNSHDDSQRLADNGEVGSPSRILTLYEKLRKYAYTVEVVVRSARR
jgi:hypothetical protein